MIEENKITTFFKQLLTFILSPSLWTFILFLVLAAVIWYGHALNAVRERQLVVPISYEGLPDNVATEQPLPKMFYVTVRDQGKRLRAYQQDAMAAVSIDLKQQIQSERGVVHINSEQVRQKVSDQLQGTAKIQHIYPEVIEVEYYKQARKQVKVQLQGSFEPAPQYRVVAGPELNPSKMYIYGKKEQIDTIAVVNTEQCVLTNVRDTISVSLDLQPIPNVRFAQDSVQMTVAAELFTEKRLQLPLQTKGVPKGEKLRLFPSTVEVIMQVKVAQYANANEETVTAYCNYPRSGVNTLKVQVKYDSQVIGSVKVKPSDVEFIIER